MRAVTTCFVSRAWCVPPQADCCCRACERSCRRRRSYLRRMTVWTMSWLSLGAATAQRTCGDRCNISPWPGERELEPHRCAQRSPRWAQLSAVCTEELSRRAPGLSKAGSRAQRDQNFPDREKVGIFLAHVEQ